MAPSDLQRALESIGDARAATADRVASVAVVRLALATGGIAASAARDAISALHRARDALHHHVVTVDVAPALPLLQADPVLLEQAVFLLADNAARHTPAGTHVLVRAFVQGEELCLEVLDDGPGIPADGRARIFQRFERGKHSSGMGLGLAICAAILKSHGGVATLLPAMGHGAGFQLRLPLPTKPPPQPPDEGLLDDHG